MIVLVKIIGISMIGFGAIFLLSPKAMKQFMLFCEKGKRLYISGMLRILAGTIFLLAASDSRCVLVMVILGILLLIGGIIIFILGLDRVKTVLKAYYAKPPLVLRLFALVAIALGVLIICSA